MRTRPIASRRWHVCPILLNGRSYFDFAQAGDAQWWEIEPAGLTPLTKR